MTSTLEAEETPCRVCYSTNTEITRHVPEPGHRFVACLDCGAGYNEPDPVPLDMWDEIPTPELPPDVG